MRHLKATILLGTISAAIVIFLCLTKLFLTPDQALLNSYGLTSPTVTSIGTQLLIVLFLSFGIVWTTVDISRKPLKIIIAVIAIILAFTQSNISALYNNFFSPFPAVLAILVAFGIGYFYSRSGSGSRKKLIEQLFGQRISRSVFNQLVNANTPVNFPGALHEGSVLVCEVQNYKELMEMLTPENYAAMMNLYLQTSCDFLVEVGGYLEECTGESLRVVFGVPIADEKHAARACRAALDLMVRLDNLNRECDTNWQRRFDFRIGVNSGEMIAGAFGGPRLVNYSVSGSAVEFARRLSAGCATYGCRILVGPETFEQTTEAFEARPIEVIKVIGERRRVELYEILAPKHGLSPERERSRDHFWRGVIYFREKSWDKAIEQFAQARITGIPDPALDFYIQRVERMRRGDEDVLKDTMAVFATA